MNKLILLTAAGVAVAGYMYRKELVAKVQALVEGASERDQYGTLLEKFEQVRKNARQFVEDSTLDPNENYTR